MAQLPPKIPSMAQNWPSFPNQRMPTMASFTQQQQPQWQVEEFLDFSSTRIGAHQRSVSDDSIAFLESPLVEACQNSPALLSTNGFDGLDDEQLMSMFSDDMSSVPPSSNPSTPSGQNSDNDEKILPFEQQQQPKNEPGEVESNPQFSPPPSGDSFLDPKRVKRILANRQSAQRSRIRKLQYVSELERSVTTLQSEVSALSPRVAFFDHQRLILNVDNSALKQRIAALAQDKIFKDGKIFLSYSNFGILIINEI
ncbi:hypothetical protein UlMin_028231 [Ulmus minor]